MGVLNEAVIHPAGLVAAVAVLVSQVRILMWISGVALASVIGQMVLMLFSRR